MDTLIECVPNFSEGRNPETVRALASAIRAVPGVFLIDEEMDYDHHRAVLTFVGAPDAVGEAAFHVTRIATDLIDLRSHHGGHPRVGATDVVPFVPIRGVTMEECIALAVRVGERIGHELQIPVFLYERAATTSNRINLEAIRRGGLEGLNFRMQTDAAWAPDFGPPRLHPTAGATVVGARPVLVAYNVNLQTRDLTVAKAIAKTIRYSNGGLPSLKALGIELGSRRLVQVSMNLTNFEETPIHAAFEAVKREAEQRGVQIAGSEVIGLIPRRALDLASAYFLKLERFDLTRILETRLERVACESKERVSKAGTASADGAEDWAVSISSLSSFLEALSAGTPTLAGGSVAALAGSLAAAFGVMACRVGTRTDPGKQSAEPAGELQPMEQRLIVLRGKLHRLIQADAEAYAGVGDAYRMPKHEPSKPAALVAQMTDETEVPLEIATLATEVASLLRTLFPITNPSVASDLKVALFMALAAIEGGLENARTNLKAIKNQSVTNKSAARIKLIEDSLVELKRL
jgi:glutamate formiminotransferase/glutamate formiminotransferase/formiminotetrahydrofolate cyclodeaminase